MSEQIALLAANETFSNASSSFDSGFANSSQVVGPLFFVVWSVIVVGFVSALRSNTHFQHIVDALGWVAVSVKYFLHGLAAIALFAVAMVPAHFVATADAGTRSTAGKYLVGALALYALVTLVGYVAKHRVFDPIRSNIGEHLPEPDEADETTEVGD